VLVCSQYLEFLFLIKIRKKNKSESDLGKQLSELYANNGKETEIQDTPSIPTILSSVSFVRKGLSLSKNISILS
jgi:hypothetical protein